MSEGLASIHTGKPSVDDTYRLSEDYLEIAAHCYHLKVIDTMMHSTLAKLPLRNEMVARVAGTYSTYMCDSWRLVSRQHL